MTSLLALSAELQLLIIEYLDTPATICDPPAAYFAPRTSRDVASLSSCCRTLRRLATPTLFRNICLRNDDKSGKSLQAVGKSSWAAGLVRELNLEAEITLDDEWEEPILLSGHDFPHSVEEVLSHLERFPSLQVLTVQFKCGPTQRMDEEAVSPYADCWMEIPDPFRDFAALKQKEETSDWKALMARTYDAISNSKCPSTLTTLELRNLLPSGVSSFTTEAWKAFLGTLQTLQISLHNSNESGFNVAWGYLGFIENLDMFFSQLASVTELRFAATNGGLPGVPGHLHTAFPLNVDDMPMLQTLELQWCFISERTARFIASHVKTLKRIALEDCYSAATCYNAEEHTTWATFLNMIAQSLEAVEDPPLEDFFVSPRILGSSWKLGRCDVGSVPISGLDQQIELAQSMSRTDPRRRPFDYGRVDDKYGTLYGEEEQNLAAFLAGRDQAAYDRVMAIVGRQSVGEQ